MCHQYLDHAACATRYPRLTTALQWVAILSRGEAGCAIRDYLSGVGRNGEHHVPLLADFGGGEAVQHFGGPRRAILRAIDTRAAAREVMGGTLYPLVMPR